MSASPTSAPGAVPGDVALGNLRVFSTFNQALFAARNLAQVLDACIRYALQLSQVCAAVAYVFDSAGNPTQEYGLSENGQPFVDEPLYSKRVARRVQQDKTLLVITGEHPLLMSQVAPALGDRGIQALIGLPFSVDDHLAVGVLMIYFSAPHPADSLEIEWLKLGGVQAFHAINRIRLLDEFRQRDADLSVLVDTAHLVNSTLYLGELLEQVAIRLAWVTGADACAIYSVLENPDRKRLLAHFTALGLKVDQGLEEEFLLSQYPATSQALEGSEPLTRHVGDHEISLTEIHQMMRFGYGAVLLMPLRVGERPIGVIELYSQDVDHHFTQTERKRVHLLSEQIALALVNARLYTQEQHARLAAETLHQASTALSSTLELSQVLGLILEWLQRVVNFDSASLVLVEGNQYRVVAVRGHLEIADQAQADLQLAGDAQVAWMLEHKAPLIINDTAQAGFSPVLGHVEQAASWMGVPLVARGDVIGFLIMGATSPGVYSDEDAQLAATFAPQAALVIANAGLYASEHEQRSIAEALREISLALSGSLKASLIMEILLEQVAKVVPFDSAAVLLVEDDGSVQVAGHRGYETFGVDGMLKGTNLTVAQFAHWDQIVASASPVIVADTAADANWVDFPIAHHIRSWIGAPLKTRERILGFLSLDKTEPNYYTAEHAARLNALAGHASLALWNAITFGEVERDSITDYLTGAYNHRYFQQQLRMEIVRAANMNYPLSLLIIDIDHFKKVNDVHGHLCGDQVLRQLAARLRSELRSVDMLARYGGEEFAALLPGTYRAWLEKIAERIRHSVAAEPFRVGEAEIHLTVSVGGATFPDHAQDATALIACADRELYEAKASGRNCVRLLG